MWILAPKGYKDEGAYAVKDSAGEKVVFLFKNMMTVRDMDFNLKQRVILRWRL